MTEEAGDNRKVTSSESRVFPVGNPNVGRAIETGPLVDSVCIQAELKQASIFFPGSQVGLFGGFIKDVDHMFVLCRARANSCVIAKLVEDLAALGALKVLFKKRGAEAML